MLTVEQVRSLDGKVRKALEVIESLKKENGLLRTRLKDNQAHIQKLESMISSFKNDQREIEEGIKDVLSQLDVLEDRLTAPEQNESSPPPENSAGLSSPDKVDAAETAAATEAKTESEHITQAEPVNVGNTTDSSPEEVKAPELEIF